MSLHTDSHPQDANLARIGCVQYLNALPLIEGHAAHLEFAHPSDLARRLFAGELDAALVPVFEMLEHPGYLAVDAWGIACRGAVQSVFMAYRGNLETVRRVRIDPASRSSVNLLRLMLTEIRGPGWTEDPPAEIQELPEAEQGIFLIGNQALEYRSKFAGQCEFWDLGEAWLKSTGLPFVFALWLVRPNWPNAGALAKELRSWAEAGEQDLEKIIQRQTLMPRALAQSYLGKAIQYHIGPDAKLGLLEYAKRLAAAGKIPGVPEIQWI